MRTLANSAPPSPTPNLAHESVVATSAREVESVVATFAIEVSKVYFDFEGGVWCATGSRSCVEDSGKRTRRLLS